MYDETLNHGSVPSTDRDIATDENKLQALLSRRNEIIP